MARAVFVLFTVISVFIGAFGMIVNFIVCLLYAKNTKLLDSANIFVLNISVCDLLYSVFAFPMLVLSNAQGEWQFGESGCIAYGFVTTVFGLSSILHLCGASYERYVTIVKLFEDGEISFDRKKAIYISVLMWSYAFVWSIMPILGWSSYTTEGIGTSCSISWRSGLTGDKAFAVCLCVFCFLVPLFAIIFCNYKSQKCLRKLSAVALQNWGGNAAATRETIQAERKMNYIIIAITIAFVVAWSPYAIVSVVSMFGPHLISDIGATIPAYLAKSSACYNPVIYVFTYRKLRRKLPTLLCWKEVQVHPESGSSRPTVGITRNTTQPNLREQRV